MQTEHRRDTLLQALADPAYQQCLQGCLNDDSLRDRIAALRHQLQMKRFVVPVYGIQGTGKSTFLNALLFKTPTLPVDADETTCVPVEVTYAASPKPVRSAIATRRTGGIRRGC